MKSMKSLCRRRIQISGLKSSYHKNAQFVSIKRFCHEKGAGQLTARSYGAKMQTT